jgi:hypothetical protein
MRHDDRSIQTIDLLDKSNHRRPRRRRRRRRRLVLFLC